jgi:hypothetical protein
MKQNPSTGRQYAPRWSLHVCSFLVFVPAPPSEGLPAVLQPRTTALLVIPPVS